MGTVTGGRAVPRALRRRSPEDALRADPRAPAVSWGRIGAFDAVSRDGILFLLAPRPAHPALRVRAGA
jgi:hypothetical protein